jgi:hypothetical protein
VETDREYGAFEKGKAEDERPAWPVQSQIRRRELLLTRLVCKAVRRGAEAVHVQVDEALEDALQGWL